jgi:hypothetical protein
MDEHQQFILLAGQHQIPPCFPLGFPSGFFPGDIPSKDDFRSRQSRLGTGGEQSRNIHESFYFSSESPSTWVWLWFGRAEPGSALTVARKAGQASSHRFIVSAAAVPLVVTHSSARCIVCNMVS